MRYFEAVLAHFGPQAVTLQLSEAESDKPALEAIENSVHRTAADRVREVRSWLSMSNDTISLLSWR